MNAMTQQQSAATTHTIDTKHLIILMNMAYQTRHASQMLHMLAVFNMSTLNQEGRTAQNA